METKFCNYCQTDHDFTKEFWFFSKKPDGRDAIQCKTRKRVKNKQYATENVEKMREHRKKEYRLNIDKYDEKRANNKEKMKTYLKEYRAKNKKTAEKNPAAKKTYKEKYDSDPIFKLKTNLRNRFRIALKEKYKKGSAVEMLGGLEAAIKHIESQFYAHPVTGEAMTWDNHSKFGWHIDHVTPLSTVDLENIEELKKVCHYNNLAPKWREQNIQKSNKTLKISTISDICLDPDIEVNGNILKFGDKTLKILILYPHILTDPKNERLSSEIRLMQFTNDEIANKSAIVESIIENYFGLSTMVNARDTDIVPVSPGVAKEFFRANHLMGYHTKAKYFGLRANGTIYSVIGYMKNGKGIEISRFANLAGHSVRGGFGKLVSFLSKNVKITADGTESLPQNIVSFCDMRYSSGASYESLGFELIKEHQSFWWSDGFSFMYRLRCRANMDDRGLSEKEHADERGLFRYYDAGQRKYEKRLKHDEQT